MTTDSPLPRDEATPKQHIAIINCVCHKLGEPSSQPNMTRVAAYLNSNFNLNLDAELEPLTKQEASNILTQLLQ